MNNAIHHSQLADAIIPGTPPADGQLLMLPIADQNSDGIDDFQITYPSGDQQVLNYYGIIDEPLEECRTLEVPPIDPTVISIPALVTQFLYTGTNPIQRCPSAYYMYCFLIITSIVRTLSSFSINTNDFSIK